MKAELKIEFAEFSHQGHRPNNQDYFLHVIDPRWSLFVVADGLGGHERGELASHIFCTALTQLISHYLTSFEKSPDDAMKQLIKASTDEMCKELATRHHFGARTTCAIVWLDAMKVVVGHVGDSRVYRFTNRDIIWQTKDHSMAQLLVDQGQLSPEEVPFHPTQTSLLRTIDCDEFPHPDVLVDSALLPNELLLLCTDGFWESIKREEMMTLVDSKNLQHSLEKLCEIAVSRAKPRSDNVTAQLCRLRQ